MSKEKKPVPEVYEREGIAVTDSRKVAEYFGKRHDHVIRDIDNIIADMHAVETEKAASDQAAPKFGDSEKYFVAGNYKDETGKSNRLYYMPRDGLMLLTMGFRGKKAMRLKLAYIARFNEMERELEARRLADYEQLRQTAIEEYKPGYHLAMAAIKRLEIYAQSKWGATERETKTFYGRINGLLNRSLGIKNGERRTGASPTQLSDLRRLDARVEDTITSGIEHQQHWGMILRDAADSVSVYCKTVGLEVPKQLH